MPRRALLLLLLGATPALGQDPPVQATRANVEFARRAWRGVHGHLVQAATAAPDSLFGFKPV